MMSSSEVLDRSVSEKELEPGGVNAGSVMDWKAYRLQW